MQGIEGIMQAPGIRLPAALAAITLVLSAMLATARAETMRLLTNQGEREAIVLPSRQGPAPTILVLHGALSTASYAAENSGFGEAAAEHGFTAVFPQGIRKQWNDGREAQAAGVDDVGFLSRLVTALVGRGLADPKQIYIAGVSNGGMMTFRMLCEASELFAGAATVIANMPTRIGERCAPRKPLPVVMFNGTADPLIPYAAAPEMRPPVADLFGQPPGVERAAPFVDVAAVRAVVDQRGLVRKVAGVDRQVVGRARVAHARIVSGPARPGQSAPVG